MHLFAPERPEASPGRKALLIDGSAVPQVMVFPAEEPEYPNYAFVNLAVMLRNYHDGGGFSYSWREKVIRPVELGPFFILYENDPEKTLELYFGWKPQAVVNAKPKAQPSREAIDAQNYVESLL